MSKQAPLTWLRSFEAAARNASFTQAAMELNITQAAVSKQIKGLETQLNCQLFKRHAHGLSLTEQGRRYWLDTRDLVRQLDNVTNQFFARQVSNRVNLRCNISYSSLVLCSQLATFRRLHPDISIEISHDIWEPGVSSHNAHLVIGYGMIDKKQEQLSTVRFLENQLFPVVASHLSDEAISQLPLIHVSGYYREWDWWLEQTAESELPPVLAEAFANKSRNKGRQDWSVDNSLIAYQLAKQGLGIALGRQILVKGFLQDGSLRQFSAVPAIVGPEGFYIYRSELGEQHRASLLLFDYLTGQAGLPADHERQESQGA